jgi:hypothetical protein
VTQSINRNATVMDPNGKCNNFNNEMVLNNHK